MKKKTVVMQVSLHEIAADIAINIQSGKIDLSKDTLRGIADKIGRKGCSPQQIKHHLQGLVTLGFLSIVGGNIIYIAPVQEKRNPEDFKKWRDYLANNA